MLRISLLSLCLMTSLAWAQPRQVPPPIPTPVPTPVGMPTPTPAATPRPNPNPTPAPQDPRRDDTPATSTAPIPVATTGPAATPTPTGTPVPKTIEELTKGYDKLEGVFTLYRKTENHDQKLLAEVREDQVGPLFLLQSTYATGNSERINAGRPARDLVWRFKKTPDDRLILSVPNLWFRSTDPNLKNAVQRDFPDAYLDVFPILAHSKERKTMLIDFSGLFDGSVTGLNTAFEAGGPLRALIDSYALDNDLSFIEDIKNFPTNLVVEASYHFKRIGPGSFGGASNDAQADPRSLPVKVTFNLYGLPQTDYKPRLADPRVGFFINGQLSADRTGYESFDNDAASDPRVVYINRWNLQKVDPSAKLSAPVKPITFYLDNSIPQDYREAVRQAILSWNRAFVPLGFKGAIVVKDAPINDWDTADMRFNTIRWVASDPANGDASAVALLRENPLTGEILNAGINVDSNFARFGYLEKEEVINPLDTRKIKPRQDEALDNGGVACALDSQWVAQAEEGQEAAQAMGLPLDNKAYVNELLREIVTHEFGHILGLRHNFTASTFLTPSQLADPKVVKAQGTTASVMDYVGYNVFGLKTGAPLYSSGPGKYDMWAISYGYTPTEAASPNAEKKLLAPIAARSTEHGLAFQSDELADDHDPTIVRYDLSSDPLTYAEKSFEVTRELLRTLGQRRPRDGETYSTFTRRLRGLIRVNARDAALTARFIGGDINRRAVKGTPNQKTPYQPVRLAEQRRALDILSRRIFSPTAFQIPKAYLNRTEADPYDFEDSGADAAFPIRDDIARVRLGVLNNLFSGSRLVRIANSTWKFPGQTIDFGELFGSVRRAVWGDLSAKTTFTPSQRDLARAHLRILLDLATDKRPDAPADARLTAFGELQTLKGELTAPRASSPDAFSRLFFSDELRRINAALVKKPE